MHRTSAAPSVAIAHAGAGYLPRASPGGGRSHSAKAGEQAGRTKHFCEIGGQSRRDRVLLGELGRDLDDAARIVGAPVDVDQPAQGRDMAGVEVGGAQEHVVGAVDIAEVDEDRIAESVQALGALGGRGRERHELVEVARRGLLGECVTNVT